LVDVSRRPQAAVFFRGVRSHGEPAIVPPEEVIVVATLALVAQSNGGSGALGLLLPLLLMGGIFYFLLIRPQQRQRRKQAELLQSLEVGDEVQTVGGMFGTIRSLDDDRVLVEIAPGVEVSFLRGAIARKLVFDDSYQEEPAEEEEEEAGDQK
jgi:preprotein translocase subunit YajC